MSDGTKQKEQKRRVPALQKTVERKRLDSRKKRVETNSNSNSSARSEKGAAEEKRAEELRRLEQELTNLLELLRRLKMQLREDTRRLQQNRQEGTRIENLLQIHENKEKLMNLLSRSRETTKKTEAGSAKEAPRSNLKQSTRQQKKHLFARTDGSCAASNSTVTQKTSNFDRKESNRKLQRTSMSHQSS